MIHELVISCRADEVGQIHAAPALVVVRHRVRVLRKSNINRVAVLVEDGRELLSLNVGPHHPATHGVLRLLVTLDGEILRDVKPIIGYVHTGIEKTAEQKSYWKAIPVVERMDYLGAQSNSLAYCMSVERLIGLESAMPDRVIWIRVLIAELQRLSSHLVWLGTHGMEIGAGAGGIPVEAGRSQETRSPQAG